MLLPLDGQPCPDRYPDVLEDYLATCKEACDSEINRLYGSGERRVERPLRLILDYPLRREGTTAGALHRDVPRLGGHVEAVLPTAATLELYHNAFLIHDDIEDESSAARQDDAARRPRHPIAVNVGDAMLRSRCSRCSTTSSSSGWAGVRILGPSRA